jgi:regulator of protease activity HflC (stomatin/prohibitin superfamily)
MPDALTTSLIPIFIILLILASAIKILREYERGVVFTLGRFWGVKGPGLIIIIPGIQQFVRVDLRTRVLDVPPQDVISRDNVSVRVNAVIYYRVIDAERAVIQVEEFEAATSQLAQTTLRSVVGQHDLDEMLAEREKINNKIQDILDAQTDAWGIKVSNVELKHIDLNETMVRAIAKQAEAERLRRAKVIDAEGELQASEMLRRAGDVLAQSPYALQLRYLSTLINIAGERSSTIVFPVPIDLLANISQWGKPSAPEKKNGLAFRLTSSLAGLRARRTAVLRSRSRKRCREWRDAILCDRAFQRRSNRCLALRRAA